MTATAAAPTSVLVGAARVEVVAVLANMAISALGGGCGECRKQDHERPPRPDGGDLSAAVVDAQVREHTESTTPT